MVVKSIARTYLEETIPRTHAHSPTTLLDYERGGIRTRIVLESNVLKQLVERPGMTEQQQISPEALYMHLFENGFSPEEEKSYYRSIVEQLRALEQTPTPQAPLVLDAQESSLVVAWWDMSKKQRLQHDSLCDLLVRQHPRMLIHERETNDQITRIWTGHLLLREIVDHTVEIFTPEQCAYYLVTHAHEDRIAKIEYSLIY